MPRPQSPPGPAARRAEADTRAASRAKARAPGRTPRKPARGWSARPLHRKDHSTRRSSQHLRLNAKDKAARPRAPGPRANGRHQIAHRVRTALPSDEHTQKTNPVFRLSVTDDSYPQSNWPVKCALLREVNRVSDG